MNREYSLKLAFFSFLILSLFPINSLAKKRRYSKRTLSISVVNAYTFYSVKQENSSAHPPGDPARIIEGDGQMYLTFSALELARNFGRYEIGARIQNISTNFISPFFKFNFIKNYSKSIVVPSLTLGFVPSRLLGAWSRASLSIYLSHHSTLEPFIGVYSWYKLTDDLSNHIKSNTHFHAGLRINLFF